MTNAHFIREFYNTTKNTCILIYLSEGEFEEISWVCHLCYKEHCQDRQLLIIN